MSASFSKKVKEELIHKELDSCCKKIFLKTYLIFNAKLQINNFVHTWSSVNSVIRFIIMVLKQEFDYIKIVIEKNKYHNQKKSKAINILITGDTKLLLEEIGLKFSDINSELINKKIEDLECCKKTFVRTLFITRGSVNNPDTSNYHLELQLHNKVAAENVCNFLVEVGFNFKIVFRKNIYVLYIKQANQISDIFKYMGATQSMFNFEEQRISRDFSNSINRLNNIDISNQQKTSATGIQQIIWIQDLIELKAKALLSEKAQMLCELRIKFPEDTYNDLAKLMHDYYNISISKSGINHLFREIKKIWTQNKLN